MNDFETQLTRLPLRGAPSEWRHQILQAAQAARATSEPATWWRAWLRLPRLALVAAWLLIVILRFASAEENPAPTRAEVAGWRQQLQERQTAITQLLTPPPAPEATPPHPRGAFLPRRPSAFV